SFRFLFYYVNPQERKPQAQRDWLDLLQGRAHNVHKVDVCALSLLCKSPRAQAAGAARLAGNPLRTGAQCLQSGRLCVEFILFILSSLKKGDAKQQAQPKLCLLFMTNALPR
ncbi:MAG: hypothetical protein SPL34_08415, partial [Selenomonadaceae bacterium]|nr:hypothetical protein [Selenomonadaceae bacterium]